MTIQAKLVGEIGGGHGLTDDILNAVYLELIKGKQAGLIPVLVLLQPEDFGGKAGKDKRVVRLKAVRLEPVVDQADADRVRMQIAEAYEQRQSNGQGSLDLGEEAARRYLGYVEEWRKEKKLTIKAVDEIWRETFPPDRGVLGQHRKGGPVELREFCLTHGIIHDEVPREDGA